MKRVRSSEIALGLAFGCLIGVGSYTFVYAKGATYLSNESAVCANCHIMNEHYAGWMKGSHKSVAVCNDCHTPPGFFGKYTTKALNGFFHSFAFTTGRYPDPLRIKPRNREVTEGACRVCHADMVEAIDGFRGRQDCIRCHASVGHL